MKRVLAENSVSWPKGLEVIKIMKGKVPLILQALAFFQDLAQQYTLGSKLLPLQPKDIFIPGLDKDLNKTQPVFQYDQNYQSCVPE